MNQPSGKEVATTLSVDTLDGGTGATVPLMGSTSIVSLALSADTYANLYPLTD